MPLMNAAAAMNRFIGFFLFLDRSASFHFGAVETPSRGILTALLAMSRPGSISLENYKFCLTRNCAVNLTPIIRRRKRGRIHDNVCESLAGLD